LSAVTPGGTASYGFEVNTRNRNDVVAFWHAVYQASEGYESRVQWTGNYQGNSGTTSDVFVDDVERRINYFRAMCGVPALVRVNTGSTVLIRSADPHKPAPSTLKSIAAQNAALMLIRNYNPSTGTDPAFTHDPPPSLAGWSTSAWNGNAYGNLAFGLYGPGAITQYMVEEIASGSATSPWNTLVGNRRWTLYPEATDVATGDQPGDSASRPPTNVLYISQNENELVADPTPDFVPYPAAGFFPAPINSRYWSLSRAGANFSVATVHMTDADGNEVPISNVTSNINYGDPVVLWEVDGATATKSVRSDTTFHVHVNGIAGTDIPTSFSYSVTLIHPDRLTSNQSITGSATPVSNQTTPYTFKAPKGAESLLVTTFRKESAPWTEGAEKSAIARIIDRTAGSYDLKATMSTFAGFGALTGARAFHLTFPTIYDLIVRGVPEQSFELDRDILSQPGGKLRFAYRRGFMTTGSNLAVETSADGGVTWSRIGKTISGVSNTTYEFNVSSASFNLPKSTKPLRVRFRYFTNPGSPVYTHEAAPTSPTGIFIDDITTVNCAWLEPEKTTILSKKAAQFDFNTKSAGASLVEGGEWSLALRTQLGGKWFPYGPFKSVTIAAP
jgi:hypothetical protein